MKTPAILLSVIIIALVGRLNAAVIGGPTYNPATTHSYYLLATATWTASEAEAIALGGHLVTVNNAAENTWLFTTFGGSRPLWIGINDQASEGNFVWSSGQTPGFTAWSGGEPNNGVGFGVESFGYIIENGAPFGLVPGLWNDAPNLTAGFPIYGIVEVPEPSLLAFTLVGLAGYFRMLRTKTRMSLSHPSAKNHSPITSSPRGFAPRLTSTACGGVGRV